jgi:hypothetical protein
VKWFINSSGMDIRNNGSALKPVALRLAWLRASAVTGP